MIATYREQVIPALIEKFKYKNPMAVPKLEKIVISMGLGKAVTAGEKGKIEQAEKELTVIAGQKPVRCKAVKSVANFKVREGQETGLKVTLRGKRMYEFLDRLIVAGDSPREGLSRPESRRLRQDRELQLWLHRTDRFPGSGQLGGHVPAGHECHDGDDRRYRR